MSLTAVVKVMTASATSMICTEESKKSIDADFAETRKVKSGTKGEEQGKDTAFAAVLPSGGTSSSCCEAGVLICMHSTVP